MKKGTITIEDFDPDRLQPASYDILLGFEFLIFKCNQIESIDPRDSISKYMQKVTLKSESDYLNLHPQQLILGVSHEQVGVDAKHCFNLMGKSRG